MSQCHIEPFEKPVDNAALSKATVAYLEVSGIGCERCVTRVANSLLRTAGILACAFNGNIVAVAYDDQTQIIDNLIEAVAAAGNDGRHIYKAAFLSEEPVGTSPLRFYWG